MKKGEIRILVLAQGKRGDPLKGHLATVSFRNGEQILFQAYLALSYTWSDQTDPVTIELNYHSVPIGRNLASALVSLREETFAQFFWVDALCINQKDDVEKSQQVQEMPYIYESATGVYIWLGNEVDGVEQVFTWLRAISYLRISTMQELNTLLEPTVAVSLVKLLASPWWRRVWIIQEVTVCNEAIVKCGRYSTMFSYFVNLTNLMISHQQSVRMFYQEHLFPQLMPAAHDLLTLAEI